MGKEDSTVPLSGSSPDALFTKGTGARRPQPPAGVRTGSPPPPGLRRRLRLARPLWPAGPPWAGIPERGAHSERGADRWGRRGVGGEGAGPLGAPGCWLLTGPSRRRAWREGARKHTGADRQGQEQTPGTDSCGDDGPLRALTWLGRRHPRPGRSPRAAGLPPSPAGGRAAGAGPAAAAAAAKPEPRAASVAGDELHQPTPGRSAELGGTRRRSAPVGPPRFVWGRGPHPPPAQVASGARGRGFGKRAQAP